MSSDAAKKNAALTPKKLKKQSADSFALWIIRNSFPTICSFFDASLREKETLNRLKNWYWNNTNEWLGHGSSALRRLINQSLMDTVIMQFGYRCQPLHRFVIQLLFATVAGDIEANFEVYRQHPRKHQLPEFLRDLTPFYITGLCDWYDRFYDSCMLHDLLRESPNLAHVHFSNNIPEFSTLSMLKCSQNLETITLDVDNDSRPQHSSKIEQLFNAFFKGKTEEDVMYLVDRGEEIAITFTSLKDLTLTFNEHCASLCEFVNAILQTYPAVRITLTSLFIYPADLFSNISPFLSLTLQLEPPEVLNSYHTIIYVSVPELLSAGTEDYSRHIQIVEKVNISNMIDKFLANVSYLQEIMSTDRFSEIMSFTYVDESIFVSCTSLPLSETLTVLFIFGMFEGSEDYVQLVERINLCTNLRVLCLMLRNSEVDLVSDATRMELKTLSNLEILILRTQYDTSLPRNWSIFYNQYQSRFSRTMSLGDASTQLMSNIMMAAPNLQVIQVPSSDVIMKLALAGHLQSVHTWCLTHGTLESLIEYIMYLPSLKRVLLMNYFSHSFYSRLKQNYYSTSLEILYNRTSYISCPIDRHLRF